jgi:hypothetical protein
MQQNVKPVSFYNSLRTDWIGSVPFAALQSVYRVKHTLLHWTWYWSTAQRQCIGTTESAGTHVTETALMWFFSSAVDYMHFESGDTMDGPQEELCFWDAVGCDTVILIWWLKVRNRLIWLWMFYIVIPQNSGSESGNVGWQDVRFGGFSHKYDFKMGTVAPISSDQEKTNIHTYNWERNKYLYLQLRQKQIFIPTTETKTNTRTYNWEKNKYSYRQLRQKQIFIPTTETKTIICNYNWDKNNY